MILAPILPRIAEEPRVSEARLSMVATGYAVAVALVAIVAGPVSDRVGRRRMLLAGAGAMNDGDARRVSRRSTLSTPATGCSGMRHIRHGRARGAVVETLP